MDICTFGHTQIVYDDRQGNCPLCKRNQLVEELREEIFAKNKEILKLEAEIEELEAV